MCVLVKWKTFYYENHGKQKEIQKKHKNLEKCKKFSFKGNNKSKFKCQLGAKNSIILLDLNGSQCIPNFQYGPFLVALIHDILYVQEVVTRPKILNRNILSNWAHVT